MNRSRIISLLILFLSIIASNHAVSRGIKHYTEPEPAPDFNLPDLHGVTHRLADYRGKVLVVNFWAVWCQPCIKEMPSLQNAGDQLRPDGIEYDPIEPNPTNDPAITARNQRRRDTKSYIDNPNLKWLYYLNPRDVHFGFRLDL